MRYLLLAILAVLVIAGTVLLGVFAPAYSEKVVIHWGSWGTIELTTTTLLLGAFLALLGFYIVMTALSALFGLRARVQQYRQAKRHHLAKQTLTQGLVQFTEGSWGEAEQTLLKHVENSETPLLNFLAAARAAHMQGEFLRRDDYLKRASQTDSENQIAVAVSQAEMQFSSDQLEQARATLVNLMEVSPEHPYASKLLARIYYHQEDWNQLFKLLPGLQKKKLITEKDLEKYEQRALEGIFATLANKKDTTQINLLWKKLPSHLKSRPGIVLLYCQALENAGEASSSHKLLVTTLNKQFDESLVEYYGKFNHESLGSAIKQAEKWLLAHERSPKLLLSLARLHRGYQLWGKSKTYYNSSLNLAPNATVYHEFAELLETLGEHENAQICYQYGLRFSLNGKGEVLNLLPHKKLNLPGSLSVAKADKA